MATRMQQRRGTAQQWLSTNNSQGPVLNAGEIGWESDTNKFKIGDGVNHWATLTYFTTDSAAAITQQINTAISGLVDGAPGLLNTLNELAAAMNDDPAFFTTIGTDLSNHTSATTNVHGILDTDELATKDYVTTEIGNSVVDQSTLAGDGLFWDAIPQKFAVDTTLIQERVTGVSDAEIGYLSGVTSDIQTQINSKLASADLDEAAQEAVNTALVAGTGLDKTYDDNANTITIDIDSTVATKTYADTAVSTHNDDTENVHGIANTALLATKEYADTAEADAITAAGTAADGKISTAVAALTKSSVGLGNVDNTSDANKPVSTATQTALDLKAPIASPALTGVPTAPTATAGTNTTQVATTAFVGTAVSNLVASAPAALDTLNELATALGNDASFSTTVSTSIGSKIAKSDITAKGAILVGTGSGTYTSQTVGTNGQVLTANSAQADGVEWTTISGYSAPTLGSTSIASGATVNTISALTLSNATLTGTLTAGGGVGSSGQVLASTGTGTQWVAAPAPTFHPVFAMV
jgi:hypothetical protein